MSRQSELFDTDVEIAPRLGKLLARLGYLGSTDYRQRGDGLPASHSLQHAFDIGIAGALCIDAGAGGEGSRPIPIVYVAAAANDAAADDLHREVWTQNVAPLLLVATRAGVQIRNGFAFRRGMRSIPWAVVEEGKSDQDLSAVQASSLRTSNGWRDFSLHRGQRVDERLLKAISRLSEHVGRMHPGLSKRPEIVNALIGRMLYLYVLIDRGVVDQDWLGSLKDKEGRPLCPGVELISAEKLAAGEAPRPWPLAQVWTMFDRIDAVLNGSVFPIADADRPMITHDALDLVRRALRHDDLSEGGLQFGFADVSYRSIRTETISAIYELFLHISDPQAKAEHGVFYTPPFLADYVLDEIDRVRAFGPDAVVCDPAAGSGIFLVGAYRRIVERTPGAAGRPDQLRALLSRCIHGVERNGQAADVARFSLYLTMLDYLPQARLAELAKAAEPLFPAMNANINNVDFFADSLPSSISGRVTHAIANPPWTGIARGSHAEAYLERERLAEAVGERRLSELFAWRMLRQLLAPGGALALLISTKSLVSPSAGRSSTPSFPNLLAGAMRLVGTINLSHFRYRLFRGARNPTAVLFGLAEPPTSGRVWFAAPLLTSQPCSSDGWPWAISVDRGDVVHVPVDELRTPGRAWFWNMMLQPLDRRYARLLRERVTPGRGPHRSANTLGGLLSRSGMIGRVGESPARTGLPAELVLGVDPGKPNFFRARLGLDENPLATPPAYRLPQEALRGMKPVFADIFGGDILAVTRNLASFDVVEQPFAFNSSLYAAAFSPGTTMVARRERLDVLHGLARYLRSDLAQYLFALHGRLWILDARRFDPSDLQGLPIPFASAREVLELNLANMPEEALTARFVEVFGLDPLFAAAAREYLIFRRAYRDGQVPRDAAAMPNASQRSIYMETLQDRLTSFIGDATFATLEARPHDREAVVRIKLDLAGRAGAVPSAEPHPFAWATIIEADPSNAGISLRKPLTRAAWTMERAYADAERVAAKILTA